MKKMNLFGLFFLTSMIGCGQPAYPYKEPQVRARKTLWGTELTISSDATGRIKKLEFDPKTGQVTMEDAELSTMASPVLREFAPLMAQYAAQQQAYATIRQTEWQGVNQLVSTIAPVVGQAISGQQMLSGLKLMRPRLIDEATALIARGEADPAELYKLLPPEIVSAVSDRLAEGALAAVP